VKREAGAVTWIAKVVTHEVLNIGAEPFWCVVVEHP
jgi:oxalate decarboxylase/phosphoglucose isomerase-like protein (cupin superfamily)